MEAENSPKHAYVELPTLMISGCTVPAQPVKLTVEDEMTEDKDIMSPPTLKGKQLERTSQVPPIRNDRDPMPSTSLSMPLRVRKNWREPELIPKVRGLP